MGFYTVPKGKGNRGGFGYYGGFKSREDATSAMKFHGVQQYRIMSAKKKIKRR